MKKILFITMLLLIPASGFSLSSKAVYADQKAQVEVENDKVRANNELIIAEKQAQRQAYLKENGAGWVVTVESINGLKDRIEKLDVVGQFRSVQDMMVQFQSTRDRVVQLRTTQYEKDLRQGMQAGDINGTIQAIQNTLYKGSVITANTGGGHLVQNNEIADYFDWKLFKYTLDADNGLHYVYTFGNPVTVKISDGTNMILLKINMAEPNKSRVSDGNLPVNAMNTITQVYAKKGISVSDKMLMTLIENWYKAELMPSGKTLQDTVAGLLVDVDIRSDFVKFVKAQAKIAVKPVDDDE